MISRTNTYRKPFISGRTVVDPEIYLLSRSSGESLVVPSPADLDRERLRGEQLIKDGRAPGIREAEGHLEDAERLAARQCQIADGERLVRDVAVAREHRDHNLRRATRQNIFVVLPTFGELMAARGAGQIMDTTTWIAPKIPEDTTWQLLSGCLIDGSGDRVCLSALNLAVADYLEGFVKLNSYPDDDHLSWVVTTNRLIAKGERTSVIPYEATVYQHWCATGELERGSLLRTDARLAHILIAMRNDETAGAMQGVATGDDGGD